MCPEKKKKGKDKTMATLVKIEDLSESFDWEFGFIAFESTRAGSPATQVERECALPCTSGTSSRIWYVDSGASRHMTGVWEYF